MRTPGSRLSLRRRCGRALAGLALAVLGLSGGPLLAAPPVLSVGWDDYPPYQIRPDGERPGIDMEIVQLALQQAGYAVRFVKLPWARQLSQLRSGELDLAMSASVSADRAAFVDWTEPYRRERAALMALADTPQAAEPVRSLRQLLGKPLHIGVIRDSSYPGEYEQLAELPEFRALLEPTTLNQQNLMKLRAGRIDYLIDDPVTLNYLAARQPGPAVREVHELMNAEARMMLSRKTLAREPALMHRLNTALTALQRQGVVAAIAARYGIPK